jgi:hypothetical protein
LGSNDVNDRDQILGLTRVAFLNALILSFLGIQFVIPFASIFLLVVIPVIFALQVYRVEIRVVFLSSLTVIIFSSILFGIVLGIWTLVYFVLGIALGWSCRKQIHLGLRLSLVSFLFCISLIILVLTFGWIAEISWADITGVIGRYELLNQYPLIPLMGLGLVVWGFLNALGADRILSRVLKQIYSI